MSTPDRHGNPPHPYGGSPGRHQQPPIDRRAPHADRYAPPPGQPVPPPDRYAPPPALWTAETVLLPQVEPETVILPRLGADGTPVGSGPGGPGGDGPGGTGSAGDDAGGDGGPSVARSSAVMALGSIASRATGFLRTAAIGAAIGATLVADDYTIANTLPNMVYELLLGGVLGSVIVPVLVRARKSEPDRGEAYAQRLLSLAVLFFGAATVLAVAAAPLLTALMVNASTRASDRHLITVLAYLLLPEIFFYGVAALLAAILNVRGHFAAPMWSPILNNVVVILTAGAFALLHTGTPDAANLTGLEVGVLGVGTTLGIVAQAVGLMPALRKVGFRFRWRWDFGQLGLRELGRIGSWMLLYVAVSQIGVMVVLKIAKIAGDRGHAGAAIYNSAFLLFMMAHGIVAVSIGTALMPRMSAAAADRRYRDLADQLSHGTRLTSVILIPASVAYIVLGRPLAVTLFEWGNYRHSDALATGTVIAVAGIGLVPYAVSQLQTFVFYALSDTRWPALVNIPVVALRIAVDVLFLVLLPASVLAAALMGGGAVSFVLAVLLGYRVLRRRIGRLGMGRIADSMARLAGAAAIGGAAAWLVVAGLTHLAGDGKIASMVQLVVGGAVLIAGYCAAAIPLRVEEVREVGRMVGGRLGRR